MNTGERIRGGGTPARRWGRGRGGFTLAEILFSSGLLSMAIGFVLYTMIAYQRAFVVGTSYIDIRHEIRHAMDALARDIRWTIEPVASQGGYTTSATCLVLKVPAIDATGSVIDIGTKFDYFVYRLNGKALERVVTGVSASSSRQGATTVVARDVTSLAFTLKDRNNATTTLPNKACAVEISLTVGERVVVVSSSDYSGKPKDTAHTENLSTTVTFRNTAARPT